MTKILDGKQDLRKLTAFKRSVGSRTKKEAANPSIEVLAMNSFKNLAVACSSLNPKNFHTMQTKEALDIVSKVVDEGYERPYRLKFNILMREVSKKLADKEYTAIVQLISPWESMPFDHTAPKLSGVAESASARLATFKAVLFEQVLIPMLMRGEDQAQAVLAVAHDCLQMSYQIDFVNLDSASAVAMDEVNAVFEGLKALGTPLVDAKLQELATPTHV